MLMCCWDPREKRRTNHGKPKDNPGKSLWNSRGKPATKTNTWGKPWKHPTEIQGKTCGNTVEHLGKAQEKLSGNPGENQRKTMENQTASPSLIPSAWDRTDCRRFQTCPPSVELTWSVHGLADWSCTALSRVSSRHQHPSLGEHILCFVHGARRRGLDPPPCLGGCFVFVLLVSAGDRASLKTPRPAGKTLEQDAAPRLSV